MITSIGAPQFEHIVRQYLSEKEFDQQQHLLPVIRPEHRFAFISCLAYGIQFRDCFGALDEYLCLKARREEAYHTTGQLANRAYAIGQTYTYTLDEFFQDRSNQRS